jgi:hypothetical protein
LSYWSLPLLQAYLQETGEMHKPRRKTIKKSSTIREVIISSLAIVILPFLFFHRLFFKIPSCYSPVLGIFRGAVTFRIICWLTSEQGIAMERRASLYLSSYMDIDLAKLIVDSFGLMCCILFFISVLIIGGFNMGMHLTEEERSSGSMDGRGAYPNLDHALKDFDKRLGYGTIHNLISMTKKMTK